MIEQHAFIIENGVYKGCQDEASEVFVIPEGVTEVARDSLSYTNLQNCRKIVFPTSLRKVDMDALSRNFFGRADQLRELEFMGDVDEIGEQAFCYGDPFSDKRAEYESLIFHGRVGKIGKFAFAKSNIKEITISEIDTIEEGAFKSCDRLQYIRIRSVKRIGTDAFSGCVKLSNIEIPTDAVLGEDAFRGCRGLSVDGLIIVNDILFGDANNMCYNEPQNAETKIIPEGVIKIDRNACENGVTYILPYSVRTISEQFYGKLEIPFDFLQTNEKLSGKGMFENIDRNWNLSIKDWAALYLFQSGKQIEEIISNHSPADCNQNARAMIELLEGKGTQKGLFKAAEYVLMHKKEISPEVIQGVYDLCVNNKAKKAKSILAPLIKSLEPAQRSKEEKTKTQDRVESSPDGGPTDLCESFKEVLDEYFLDKTIKEHNGTLEPFEEVFLLDGAKAPPYLVKCAIVPYLAQYEGRPKHIGNYKTECYPVKHNDVADRASQLLDLSSLRQAIDCLCHSGDSAWIIPFVRYADGKQIKQLLSDMKNWEEWYKYGPSGRSDIIVARGALMLNDTREAMIALDKSGHLNEYANRRGTDAETLRDTVIADFGFDMSGKKTYNLGNGTVAVALTPEMGLVIYDDNSKKYVKSLPKKGAFPEKYDSAKNDLAELKKNIKNVVKARRDILFTAYLNGSTIEANRWKSSYMGNPVLGELAKKIVWKQGDTCFILRDGRTIDCAGNEFAIPDEPIQVAHPIEMKKEEIDLWQHYFVTNSIKQPFVQIWEQVYDPLTIKPDRYQGRMIPYYRFTGQRKRGIYVEDYDFHDSICIFMEDCDVEVNRIDWIRHNIDPDDRFEITNFSFKEYTRQVNHIVAYLDRITVWDRVRDDDVTVIEIMDSFTFAQVMEFIKTAQEENAVNVLALLLDYKNTHYNSFEPMDEFILE